MGKRDAFLAVAISLASLVFAFVLVLLIALVSPTGERAAARAAEEEAS
jgi:hypothetical protein